MPHIKNALIRYRILDRAIGNKYNPYPSKQKLRELCEEDLFGSTNGSHICDSTIEKDLFAMKIEHDAPIKYSRKYHGYYYTDENYSLNDTPLSREDLESISFAVNTLKQFRDVSMFRQFGQAIDKIVDRVAVESKQPLEDNNELIQFESAFSEGSNDFLGTVYEAICKKMKLLFVYKSFVSNSYTNRVVSPLLLKQYRNRWYLISHDSKKKSIRTYALDRMSEVHIANDKIDLNHNFNASEYFKFATGITVFSGSKPQKVVLKASSVASKYIKSQPFHNSQVIIKQNDEYSYFELHIFIAEEFIMNILGFSGEIEVLEPVSLRQEIIDRVNQLNKSYSMF